MDSPSNFGLDAAFFKTRLAFTRSVADWCLRQAHRCMDRGQLEAALGWNHLAAGALRRGCRPLVSAALERNLLEIASRLPKFTWHPTRAANSPKRWLHVIDNALPYGGHTAMAQRWIAGDPGRSVHSVALPAQDQSIPSPLVTAIRESGGEMFLPPRGSSLMSRAVWLRELAYAKADYVVLHIGNDNVIAPAAFGVDGGPPVLLVNHSAHLFWLGTAMTDLLLDCRGSELERFWTKHYRGISIAATLPIPIPQPQEDDDGNVFDAEFRARARRRLNLPANAVVLLSVGREEKYRPAAGLDFFETARSILAQGPNVWMLVVGPSENCDRKRLRESLNGRLQATGPQFDLRAYYAAADVYMESFPFGSTTALLEAGVHGLPCVLAPADCPPPFGTDGVAVDDLLERPANVNEYARQVKELIASSERRCVLGQSLSRSIRNHHCGAGWTRYLSGLGDRVPQRHAIRPVVQPASPAEAFDHYWARVFSRFEGDPLSSAFLSALSLGLTPRLDLPLYRACRAARAARHRADGRLHSITPVVLSALLPLCPAFARKALCHGLLRLWRARRKPSEWVRSCRAVVATLGGRRSVVEPRSVAVGPSLGTE